MVSRCSPKYKTRYVISLLIILIALVGCEFVTPTPDSTSIASPEPENPSSVTFPNWNESITERKWFWMDFGDDDLGETYFHMLGADVEFYANGGVSGNDGCNNFKMNPVTHESGNVVYEGEITLLGCTFSTTYGIAELDKEFRHRVLGGQTYDVSGDVLQIYDLDGSVILRLHADTIADSNAKYTWEMLENCIYPSKFSESGEVQFRDGIAFDYLVPGTIPGYMAFLTKYGAYADFDGDGLEEAIVILSESANGVDETFSLVIVTKQEDNSVIVLARATISSAFRIWDVRVERQEIQVDTYYPYKVRTGDLPEITTLTYVYQDGELILQP